MGRTQSLSATAEQSCSATERPLTSKSNGACRFTSLHVSFHQPIVTDRLSRTPFFGFLSRCLLFGRNRLPINIGKGSFIISLEEIRRRVATKIAVDAR